MSNSLTNADDSTEVKRLIRQGWEEVAVEYSKDRLGIFERYARRLLDLHHPPLGSRMLDVGCGSGAVPLQASTMVEPEGLIVGSDIAFEMLRIGQAKAENENTDVMFCQMDAERLGFGDASFDSVICAFSLFQFIDMERSLTEMRRVLKSGGHLGLANWGPGYFSPIASLQRDLFRKFNIKPLLNNPISFDRNELLDLLTRTRFTEIQLIEETDEVWFAAPEDIWAFNMDMGPFPIMLRQQLSIDQQRDLLHEFKATMSDLTTERGICSSFNLIYALAEKGDVD